MTLFEQTYCVFIDMERKELCLFVIALVLASGAEAMSRQQLKNSGKLLKKKCMAKNEVTEDQIGDIEGGKFIEDPNVMCYVACIYQMSQVVKNNKLNYEACIKQVEVMYPPELKEPVKAMIDHCKDVSKKYKDICESSYWTTKCMYDFDPKNFIFA